MHRSLTITSFALVSALGLSGSARADDLTPPSWRFNAGTTVQHWDFSSGAAGFLPDAAPLNNTYGTPIMTPSLGTVWLPTIVGRNGVWDITGGSLNFDVPNTGVAIHQKDLWLQVTFLANAAVPTPSYAIGSSSGPFTQVGAAINTFLPGGWVHQLTQWNIPICPSFERVAIAPTIPGSVIYIDQVVIDTQCIPVPAPAAGSLLGVGGLVAMRRRRRVGA